MLCPVCKTKLAKGPQMRLQTLVEHVCCPNSIPALKDSFLCPNRDCQAFQRKIVWNSDGERYGPYTSKDISWINGNDAPFGSFQRQCNVEVYKKDENRTLFTIPDWKWLPLHGWRCNSKWIYKSNENGDVLSRKMKLEWVTRENVVHMWGMYMMMYSLKQTYKAWKQLGEDSTRPWCINELRDTVKRSSWPKAEWWRKVAAVFAKISLKHRHIPIVKTDKPQIINRINRS